MLVDSVVTDPDQVEVRIRIDTSPIIGGMVGIPLSEVVSNVHDNNAESSQDGATDDPMNGRLNTELYIWGGSVDEPNSQSGPTKVPFFQLSSLERITYYRDA